ALGCQPFAQPYRDFEHEGKPSREQWRLAYWCNRKPLFYSVDYEEYRKNRT
ncbi:radical SAM protein, partial [Proteus mirabilis]|nr:radical SAM protein [Proteus mirabilis]